MSAADAVMARLAPLQLFAEPQVAGGLRRAEEAVDQVDVLLAAADRSTVRDALAATNARLPSNAGAPDHDVATINGVPVALWFAEPKALGLRLLELTGGERHLEALRELAGDSGRRLEDAGPTEEDIYRSLGLDCIPPELRHGDDEIAAAREGTLPHLIEPSDIRGDLHLHTTFSDGRNTLAEMVTAAAALGYEYIAITDHSPRSASSRNLSHDSLRRQGDEIQALRADYPGMTILHGCEVDILADGSLDFEDDVLERLDIVLASLHERFDHTPAQLLERYMKAMRHPLVSLITHPTNRLLPYRPGYDLDYDELFAAAADSGTLVEIDGAPAHLDLNGALARRAVAAGATLSIDSDCHVAERLGRQMRFGVMLARRGWIETRHVLNTRSVTDVLTYVASKRRT